jgi:hypothetical protein
MPRKQRGRSQGGIGPSTATTSPGRAPLLRRALNVVMPAHISGAASAGGSSAGGSSAGIAATALAWPRGALSLPARTPPCDDRF